MKIQIEKMGINGEGIGYYRNKPAFIAGCFPGETVEWKIREDCRSYCIGSLIRVEKRSKQRRKAFCSHNRLCGSCPLMTLQYEAQLENKRELLKEAFFKYAHQEIEPEMTVASDRQMAYRNKCALPVVEADSRLVNALYQSSSNKPVIIDRCPLHEETLEEIRLEVLSALNKQHLKAYDNRQKRGIRHLMVRGFDDQYQAVIVTGEEKLPQRLIDDIVADSRIVSLYQIVNTVRNPVSLLSGKSFLLAGKKNIDLNIEGKKFALAPQSFFQLNTQQAINIYRKVRDLLGEKCGTVVEAFCGIGVMSLMLAERCQKIIGIDIEKSAVENARENARINGIGSAEFICADANEEIGRIARRQPIDVMVVDPPRSGLGDDFIETILKSRPKKIIYVSCNPATLAKNVAELERHYEVTFIQPYDMFPQTPHVETVVLLSGR